MCFRWQCFPTTPSAALSVFHLSCCLYLPLASIYYRRHAAIVCPLLRCLYLPAASSACLVVVIVIFIQSRIAVTWRSLNFKDIRCGGFWLPSCPVFCVPSANLKCLRWFEDLVRIIVTCDCSQPLAFVYARINIGQSQKKTST